MILFTHRNMLCVRRNRTFLFYQAVFFNTNTGNYRKEKKYRKIQEHKKNTGICRKYRNGESTVNTNNGVNWRRFIVPKKFEQINYHNKSQLFIS